MIGPIDIGRLSNMPGIAPQPKTADKPQNVLPAPPSIPEPGADDIKPLKEVRNETEPLSNPVKSEGVTQVQGALAKEVTGPSIPYNRITLPNGRSMDVEFDDKQLKQMAPGRSEEEYSGLKKQFIEGNKEKLTQFLGDSRDNLPEDMKSLKIDVSIPPNPMIPQKEYPDVNYDPDKKTLNMPFYKLSAKKEDLAKELQDAKDPELQQQRKKLSELGIKWSDPMNLLNAKEEVEIMKSLEGAASKVSPDKRPKDVPVTILKIPAQGGGLFSSGPQHFMGDFHTVLKNIGIYETIDDKGKKQSIDSMKNTAVHEYGHAVADYIYPDKGSLGERVFDTSAPMTDRTGKSLTDRAVAVEADAAKAGHKPDDIADDKTGTLYDRFDPYVESHPLVDENGKPEVEKYARYNKDEHYAETFTEYVRNPERFRSKIKDMEEQLKSLKPDSPEYKYLKESTDIMNESYGYFKNNIFGGYEYGK